MVTLTLACRKSQQVEELSPKVDFRDKIMHTKKSDLLFSISNNKIGSRVKNECSKAFNRNQIIEICRFINACKIMRIIVCV